MRRTYDEIVSLLRGELGQKLGMDASRIDYNSEEDSGPQAPGYTTHGTMETITIPDEYLRQAGIPLAEGAADRFLAWLRSQD